jgi:hypothetical protein
LELRLRARTSLVLVELTLKRFLFRIFGEDHLDSRSMRYPVDFNFDFDLQAFVVKAIRNFPSLIRFAFEEDVWTRFLDRDGEIRLSRRGVGVAGKVWMTRGRVKLIVISSCRGSWRL